MVDDGTSEYRPRRALPFTVDSDPSPDTTGPDTISPDTTGSDATGVDTTGPDATGLDANAPGPTADTLRPTADTPAVAPRHALVMLDPESTLGDQAPEATVAPTPRPPRRHRRVLIGAIAAALVVALGLGYSGWALLTGRDPMAAAERITSSEPSQPPPLPDRQMLDPQRAAVLDPHATWTISSDARGVYEKSAAATCLADTLADEPQAQATRIRTLTASGTNGPAVFHQADEYATAEQATRVLTVRAHALGGCDTPKAQIISGWVGDSLGDQAVGVTVLLPGSSDQSPGTYHSILLNRTGRIINVVDVASPGKAVAMKQVAEALGSVTDAQCTAAVGLCATGATISAAVPPIGGTVPGFLTLADIPQVNGSRAVWTPSEPTRTPKIAGTDCEGVDLARVKGSTATEARTYLLGDDPSAPFGFDTLVVTMPSASAAQKTAHTIATNIATCSKRVLTAEVSGATDFSGDGIKDTKVAGRSYVVTQKVNKGKTTYRYRVGVASAGDKVVYLFANPTTTEDFTNGQWRQLNLRAGQRATQIN